MIIGEDLNYHLYSHNELIEIATFKGKNHIISIKICKYINTGKIIDNVWGSINEDCQRRTLPNALYYCPISKRLKTLIMV